MSQAEIICTGYKMSRSKRRISDIEEVPEDKDYFEPRLPLKFRSSKNKAERVSAPSRRRHRRQTKRRLSLWRALVNWIYLRASARRM